MASLPTPAGLGKSALGLLLPGGSKSGAKRTKAEVAKDIGKDVAITTGVVAGAEVVADEGPGLLDQAVEMAEDFFDVDFNGNGVVGETTMSSSFGARKDVELIIDEQLVADVWALIIRSGIETARDWLVQKRICVNDLQVIRVLATTLKSVPSEEAFR